MPDRPVFNRALQGDYEPASTRQLFMARAGLGLGERRGSNVTYSSGVFHILVKNCPSATVNTRARSMN